MTPLAMRALSTLLEAHTGQQLTPGRRWRLDTSLQQVMRRHDITNPDVLAARASAPGEAALAAEVIDALLNHETSFYRDMPLFTTLQQDVLPALAEARANMRKLRVWSAGCSTGQEPYSLAMGFADDPRWRHWQIEIVATDVSTAAIEQAREGLYTQFEVQRGMPIRQLVTHFEDEGENGWRISDDMRSRVSFNVHNLLKPLNRRRFDLVLCRNVLFYFTAERRAQVFERLTESIAEDGLLMLGAGETVLGQTDAFVADPKLRGFYRARG